ncbi:sigma-70 family RNA polymerase sigma factor [Isoptericola sp. S6320L]|uniref:RNA polymerase sigma factor n=1 Tax=Isoptericola sp. S6320L TaxID=2926411 RepID=UPI001FF468E7|nr:sigma-70 family RNA polymerase sigma factor [Isoptericola sp. S6320L]MCK0117637.1 sigma-70 family RNA polymerase sigma factor [Isoptericola sp. S6320L]
MTAGPDMVFSEVFRAMYPEVLRFVQRRAGPDAAEDLAAEVFTIAWGKWGAVPREVRPWLFGVARNVLAEDRRVQGRRRRLELRLGGEREPLYDEVGLTAMTVDLQVAWARLSDVDREALALVAWDGLTGREAAQVLGCTRAAFSVRLSRARRRLKRLLSDVEPHAATGSTPCVAHDSTPSTLKGTP